MQTFDATFDPQHNRLHVVRHFAAMAVVVDHSFILSGHDHALSYVGFKISLGLLGVAVFFVISGALITASFLHSRTWVDFVWRRFLRIYPAYVSCLFVTALAIGPIAASLSEDPSSSATNYWIGSPSPLEYVVKNSLLMQFQNRIGALFSSHPESFSINGSLWSIPWEVGCYLLVFILGLVGFLKRFRSLVVVLAIIAYLHFLAFSDGSIFGRYYLTTRITLLPIYFLSGAAFYLYREWIPRLAWMGVASLRAFVVLGLVHWPTAALFLPYCIFWVAHRDRSVVTTYPDFSYGIYIYGFPLQQVLFGVVEYTWSLWAYTLASALMVIPPAAISWFLIESPCLRLKRIAFRGNSARPAVVEGDILGVAAEADSA